MSFQYGAGPFGPVVTGFLNGEFGERDAHDGRGFLQGKALDATLGRLIEKASPEWGLVASDHGFGGSGDQVLYLNRFLEQAGWLHYKSDPHRASAEGIRAGSGWVDRAKAAALKALSRKTFMAALAATIAVVVASLYV